MRAETCPGCHSYLKLLYLENDAEAEALSADLSSLMLDMRLEQEGYQRPGAESVAGTRRRLKRSVYTQARRSIVSRSA